MPCLASPRPALPCPAAPCPALPRRAVPCPAAPCPALPGLAAPCLAKPGDYKSILNCSTSYLPKNGRNVPTPSIPPIVNACRRFSSEQYLFSMYCSVN